MSPTAVDRVFSPWVMLGAFALAMIAFAIFEGDKPSEQSLNRLTTYAYDANGARGLYEVLEKLDRPVDRRIEGFRSQLDSMRVYAVLDPAIEPTAAEIHSLLNAVRRGAGLVVAISRGSRLGDSLGVNASANNLNFSLPLTLIDSTWAVPDSIATRVAWPRAALVFRHPPRGDTTTIVAAVRGGKGRQRRLPIVLGTTLGLGKVVLIADPTFLRNDLLRHGNYGILAARIVDWASPSPNAPVVFDEYHQGFGTHANLIGAATRFLTVTPEGRTVLQIVIASLIVLVAASIRPLQPREVERSERRSALEHVDALAAAYQRAGATPAAVKRLVRGLRRRHPTAGPGGDLRAFLEAARARRPAVAPDTLRVAEAMDHRQAAHTVAPIAQAIDRIDTALSHRS